MTAPSRTIRARAPRRMTPRVTCEPAIVPNREILIRARTSASPRATSSLTGRSIPTSAFAVGERARFRARAHVEADDQRARGGGEIDVALGDAPDAGMDDADAHLG